MYCIATSCETLVYMIVVLKLSMLRVERLSGAHLVSLSCLRTLTIISLNIQQQKMSGTSSLYAFCAHVCKRTLSAHISQLRLGKCTFSSSTCLHGAQHRLYKSTRYTVSSNCKFMLHFKQKIHSCQPSYVQELLQTLHALIHAP